MKATVLVLLSLLSIGMSPAVEISFPGRVPSLESLNSMHRRDAGNEKLADLKAVRYSSRGEITGFVVN
jgi:hypothetical protein